MSKTGHDALGVVRFAPGELEQLAAWYDCFAFALDPDDPKTDAAEEMFNAHVQTIYSYVESAITPHEFRRGIIRLCLKHLRATRKPNDISI